MADVVWMWCAWLEEGRKHIYSGPEREESHRTAELACGPIRVPRVTRIFVSLVLLKSRARCTRLSKESDEGTYDDEEEAQVIGEDHASVAYHPVMVAGRRWKWWV